MNSKTEKNKREPTRWLQEFRKLIIGRLSLWTGKFKLADYSLWGTETDKIIWYSRCRPRPLTRVPHHRGRGGVVDIREFWRRVLEGTFTGFTAWRWSRGGDGKAVCVVEVVWRLSEMWQSEHNFNLLIFYQIKNQAWLISVFCYCYLRVKSID